MLIADLVPLLYRPRWADRTWSGRLTTSDPGDQGRPEEQLATLLLAPGGRYRAELTDSDGDRTLHISDGQLAWEIEDGEAAPASNEPRRLPFADLLYPAWLLAGYALELTGEDRFPGRACYHVTGRQRLARVSSPGAAARISAVVDAETGILLRCTRTEAGAGDRRAAFTELAETASLPDPALFTLPAGIPVSPGEAGPRPGPRNDSDEPMSDELVGLLYRSGLSARYSAVLHERADGAAMAAAVRDAGSGGGTVLRTLAGFTASKVEGTDQTYRLAMALPRQYRIESQSAASKVRLYLCDGEYQWQVYRDSVLRRPLGLPSLRARPLVDLAWLLKDHRLVPAGTEAVAGRDGFRLVAEPLTGFHFRTGLLAPGAPSVVYDQVEVVIDAELGALLRGSWRLDGRTLVTTEVTSFTPGADPAAFDFEPPPGLPVHTSMAGAAATSLVTGLARRLLRPRP